MDSKIEPILVGDIGGTNTRLAIAHWNDGDIQITDFKKFTGNKFPNFNDIVEVYLRNCEVKPSAASLAIAGPVHDNYVKVTNRDWQISAQDLATQFGFTDIEFYNDFAAMSRSVLLMDDDSFVTLFDSGITTLNAPILVAGPGTGFGVGIVLPCSESPHVIATEGGHQAYAPVTKAECEVMHILQTKFDFVPLELLCSGSGMNAVHEAICKRHKESYSPLPPDLIRQRAKEGDKICLEVCELRSAAIMGAAGDMALSTGALGGVVLAGGESKRLSGFIRAPKAMERFFNRGRRSDYMKRITVRLLTNPEAPLYGAAALFQDRYFSA